MTKNVDWFPATVGTHFGGLPVTDGKWMADRDRNGRLMGWLEVFGSDEQGWFSIPGASRYIDNNQT
jgi:hypothetical protein